MDASADTQVEVMAIETFQNCSYCSSEEGSAEAWLQSPNITPTQYQMLLDRGWRRIGYYICKPIVDKGCCRQYAIRSDVINYKLSKSQRRVLKRMNKFLMTEGDDDMVKWKEKIENRSNCDVKNQASASTSDIIPGSQETEKLQSVEKVPYSLESVEMSNEMQATPKTVKKTPRRGLGPDPNKPKCLKSKLRRRVKKEGSLYHNSSSTPDPHVLLRSSIPHLNASPQFKRDLKVTLVPARESDTYFHSTAGESFDVFKKFQTIVMKESESDWTYSKWSRCFIDCPVRHDYSGTGPGYGNFHQHYILDGKIIAVGVLTLLPNAIVTEYFYYNPDYGFLTLGIYSAISEICFMNELYRTDNRYRRYYLGSYTHTSLKMRYKLQFTQSEILCPHTYKWIPVQDCYAFLLSGRTRLNPSSEEDDPDQNELLRSTFDINKVLVCFECHNMTYRQYEMFHQRDENAAARFEADRNEELMILKEYVALVGDVCATHIPVKVPPSVYPM